MGFIKDTMNEKCTVYRTSAFIGKKWMLPILLEIWKSKSKRYSEIKRQVPGITPKILSLRLKELEKEGMVSKKVNSNTFPISSHYTLTKSGKDFIKVIESMKRWALKWKYKNKICSELDCKKCIN